MNFSSSNGEEEKKNKTKNSKNILAVEMDYCVFARKSFSRKQDTRTLHIHIHIHNLHRKDVLI